MTDTGHGVITAKVFRVSVCEDRVEMILSVLSKKPDFAACKFCKLHIDISHLKFYSINTTYDCGIK